MALAPVGWAALGMAAVFGAAGWLARVSDAAGADAGAVLFQLLLAAPAILGASLAGVDGRGSQRATVYLMAGERWRGIMVRWAGLVLTCGAGAVAAMAAYNGAAEVVRGFAPRVVLVTGVALGAAWLTDVLRSQTAGSIAALTLVWLPTIVLHAWPTVERGTPGPAAASMAAGEYGSWWVALGWMGGLACGAGLTWVRRPA